MKNLYSLTYRFSSLIMIIWFCGVLSAQPKMECYLTSPKELVFDSVSRNFVPNPFKVEVTLINNGDSSVIGTRMRFIFDPGIVAVYDTGTQYRFTVYAIARKTGDTINFCALFSFVNHPDIKCCEKIWIPAAGAMTDIETKENKPSSFYLGQNYPNPFTQTTTIKLPLLVGEGRVEDSQWRGEVLFKVYDIFGREVLDLSKNVIGNFASANPRSSLVINNFQLPSQGIYFYRLTVGNESQTRMMTLIK